MGERKRTKGSETTSTIQRSTAIARTPTIRSPDSTEETCSCKIGKFHLTSLRQSHVLSTILAIAIFHFDAFRFLNRTAQQIVRVNDTFSVCGDKQTVNWINYIFSENARRGTSYYRNNDMVMYAIDLNKICYAIKIFPTPFDAKECTFDDYLTLSLEKATELYRALSLEMCDVNNYPQISRCTDISPFQMKRIKEMLKFGNWRCESIDGIAANLIFHLDLLCSRGNPCKIACARETIARSE